MRNRRKLWDIVRNRRNDDHDDDDDDEEEEEGEIKGR